MTALPLKQLLADNTHESAPELVQPLSDGALRCVSCGHRCVIKPGRVMFEVEGVPEDQARSAFRLAHHKLPIATRFVKREAVL